MDNPVTLSELGKALSATEAAWEVAQQIADALPSYLEENDLTIEKYYERNKDKITPTEARAILDKLVSDGIMRKEYRRQRGKGGSRTNVYVLNEDKQNAIT